MSQFKIFRNFRRVFFFVGYLPEERILDGKYGHAVTSFLFICTLFACELTSIAYVVHHWKIGDYKNSLFACLQVAAIIPSIASFCTIMYHRDQLREVIDQFQRIFDESQTKASAAHFARCDQFSEKCLKIALIAVLGGYIASSMMVAAMTFMYYYKRDGLIEFKHIYLPLKTSSPFNENTLLGWASVFCMQLVFGAVYTMSNIPIATFFLAIGLYFGACAHQFRCNLACMSNIRTEEWVHEIRQNMKLTLIEAVKFHKTVKKIFEMLRIIMSPTIFFQLLLGILYMSTVNSSLEIAATNLDVNIVLLIFSSIPTSTGTVFLYCYVGSLTTDHFLRFSDIVYDSEWYKVPIELRNFIQLIIADAQKPVVFYGLQIIHLNLAAFTKITKTVVTYVMVFRKVSDF